MIISIVIALSLIAARAYLVIRKIEPKHSNLAIPSSCAPPPLLHSEASSASKFSAQGDTTAVALAAGRVVLAGNTLTFGLSSRAFADPESVSTYEGEINPALLSNLAGIEQVARGTIGPSRDLVYETTVVEEFSSAAAAIARNERIYSVTCAEGGQPSIVTYAGPGRFLIPRCLCSDGISYSEISLVAGRFRIAVRDWDPYRSEEQILAWSGEVVSALSL